VEQGKLRRDDMRLNFNRSGVSTLSIADNFCHIRHTASFRHAKSPVFMRLLADWRSWRIF
jgi:hypothetical protein